MRTERYGLCTSQGTGKNFPGHRGSGPRKTMQPRPNTAADFKQVPFLPDDSQWDHSPLVQQVERLFDPAADLEPEQWPDLAAKYFFAYVHPGSEKAPVPLAAVRELMELFARQESLNEPDDDIEVMNLLRRHSRPLAPLSDPALAGHVLRAVADMAPRWEPDRPVFQGVDLFSGAGWLVLAQHVLARRLGFGDVRVLGLEPDPGVAERGQDLLERLGLGRIRAADPADPEAPALLPGPPDFVSTGALGWHERILTRGGYFAALSNLSRYFGGLVPSACFPEGLVVYSRETGVSLLLSGGNLFQGPPDLADTRFTVQGLYVDNRLTPLHRMGEHYR